MTRFNISQKRLPSMIRFWPIAIVVLFFSCSHQGKTIDDSLERIDSNVVVTNVRTYSWEEKDKIIDSMLYYYSKQVDYHILRDDAEIKYLRTNEEKYRRLGNVYVDSGHYCYLQLERLCKLVKSKP
jgi:hypothetical protein